MFFLGNLTFKLISTFKYFTYITVRMTTNIGANILWINFFNLERTSLSLVLFGFRKGILGGDGRVLWSLGDFETCLQALRKILYNRLSAGWYVRTSVILSSTFSSRIWNKTVLSTKLIFSIFEVTLSSLYPRFTNHCFNYSRWL